MQFSISSRSSPKVCGCYLVRLSCSPTSTAQIYTTKLMSHQETHNETYVKNQIQNQTSLDLVKGIRSACLLIFNMAQSTQRIFSRVKFIVQFRPCDSCQLIKLSFYQHALRPRWGPYVLQSRRERVHRSTSTHPA